MAALAPKIMQRPGPAGVLRKNKGLPAAVGIPTTIFKKDSSTMILEKEEKKDDHGHNGMMIMQKPEGRDAGYGNSDASSSPTSVQTTEAAACTNGVNSPSNNQNAAPWNPLEEVDSALLSALCDSRERKALFRLEQVMLDFMKDASSGSMEVGGAYNSIVLNQIGGSGGVGGEIADGFQTAPAISQQGQVELQYQQQRGLRQTSFQRLICHRLADRFAILREQVNHAPAGAPAGAAGDQRGTADAGGNPFGGGAGQQFSPGLIRLVKTEGSVLPSRLLIDIDLSVLINYKNPRAKSYSAGGSTNIASANAYDNDRTRNLAEGMESATLAEQTASNPIPAPTAAPSGSGAKKTKKKMVIMKRNSSSESGNQDGSSTEKKGKSRRKKLEDREKAYEEARARIFGIKEANEKNNNNGGDDSADKGEAARQLSVPQSQDSSECAPTPLTSCHSSFSLEKDVASGGIAEHILPSQLISSATAAAENSSPPSPAESRRDREPSSPTETAAEVDAPRHTSSSSVPAAATGGAISKAVYRNRQQEENDPDFKRRNDVRSAYVNPYAANPYGAPGGANPYAAMNQQAPPPQMIAMHNMQQQAAHQNHFYHGQPGQFPNPQGHPNQFPTPQDANLPSQWVSPQRGYYPPSQQQGQDNKHPQAWQPRTNQSQQMPHNNGGSVNHGANQGAHQPDTPPNTTANNFQPQPQTKQPAAVLWGPGARGNSKATETTQQTSPLALEKVLKREDFPALG